MKLAYLLASLVDFRWLEVPTPVLLSKIDQVGVEKEVRFDIRLWTLLQYPYPIVIHGSLQGLSANVQQLHGMGAVVKELHSYSTGAAD